MDEITEKNEYLKEQIGIRWLEVNGVRFVDRASHDYFTAEGRQVLLEWAVEEEWWRDLAYKKEVEYGEHYRTDYHFREELLTPIDALGRAIYSYLKERE